MTCASVAHSLCWPGLACLPSPLFPQLARNERVGPSARWGILRYVLPRYSQGLGTRLFPAPPWSIPVLQLRSTAAAAINKVVHQRPPRPPRVVHYKRSSNWPLVGARLEPQPSSQLSTPNADFSAYCGTTRHRPLTAPLYSARSNATQPITSAKPA